MDRLHLHRRVRRSSASTTSSISDVTTRGFSSAEERWLSGITQTLQTWRYVDYEGAGYVGPTFTVGSSEPADARLQVPLLAGSPLIVIA
jgi:hypothetical protein